MRKWEKSIAQIAQSVSTPPPPPRKKKKKPCDCLHTLTQNSEKMYTQTIPYPCYYNTDKLLNSSICVRCLVTEKKKTHPKVKRKVTNMKSNKRITHCEKSWYRSSNGSEASSGVLGDVSELHTRAQIEWESKGSTTVSAAAERGAAEETAGLSVRAPPAGGLVEFSSFYDRRRRRRRERREEEREGRWWR